MSIIKKNKAAIIVFKGMKSKETLLKDLSIKSKLTKKQK